MRLDTAIVHEPVQHLGRAIGAVTDQALGIQIEVLQRALDHALCARISAWRIAFVASMPAMIALSASTRWFTEQAKNAGPRCAAVHRVAGSAGAMNLGVTSLAAPNVASSRTARYSSTARPAAYGGRPAAPWTRLRSLVSA